MAEEVLQLPTLSSSGSTATILPQVEAKSILKREPAAGRKSVSVALDSSDEEESERLGQGRVRRARFNEASMERPSLEARQQEKEELTTQQIDAFRQVFDMLDKDGGGSIDAEELYNSMKDLDVNLTKEEITEILKELDNDGNGEIDFEEFLFMMTNMSIQIKEAQQGELKVENPRLWKRQSIFFSVITKFAIQHSLCEIERYYASKARQVPHVVGYYAAGARVDGLSDKQLQQTWKNLSIAMKDEKSPYAKPLNFVIPVPGSNRTKKKTIRPRRKPPANITSAHSLSLLGPGAPGAATATTVTVAPLGASMKGKDGGSHGVRGSDLSNDYMGGISYRQGQRPRRGRKKGWTPIYHLPIHKIQFPVVEMHKKNKDLTIEHLPRIRRKVENARIEYVNRLSDVKEDMAKRYWDSLHVDDIPSARLQENFMRVFRAYSPKKEFEAAYSLWNDERYSLPVAAC